MEKLTANSPEAQSADLIAANIARLKALFPELVSEDKNGAAINVDVLKALVGDATVSDADEKYGLNWHGKRAARQLALTPSTGTLRPCPEESVDWDSTQNLMIEGDNLEVLKLLQKSYAGKVKLIYIDPPYNTGKDFVYPDNYQDNIKNYLQLTGQTEGGQKISSNTESSGRFHTDWLNMMYPRLKLARNLLREDGVFLASINDIEVSALRFMLNDIFGEENFLCQFVWNNEGNVDQQSKIKGVHEYILAYVRRLDLLPMPDVIDPNIEESSKLFNDQIENSITKNGPANPPSEICLPIGFPATFESGQIEPRANQWPHILDTVVVSENKLISECRMKSGWSSRNLLELYIKNGCIPIKDSSGKETWFAVTPTGAIYGYKRRSDTQGHVLSVIRNVGTTKQNSSMLATWGINFSYPKPIFLLQYLIQIFTNNNHKDIVLDFFAGSGTTGHAVYTLNSIDDGNRRFILVQLPELPDVGECKISELIIKRLKSVKKDIERRRPQRDDTGFRVLKLDTSNIRAWNPQPENLQDALLDYQNNLLAGRSEADVLYELLLKLGLDLCVPIEMRDIANFTVYAVGGGVLLACLAEEISREQAEPLALGIAAWHKELAPAGDSTCVFRDNAFADDATKTNLSTILEQHGIANVRSL